MTGPVEDLLDVAAIFVAVERESRERRRIFLFSFLKSRVWLSNLANMASLELCIYRVVKGEKVKEDRVENSSFRDNFIQDIDLYGFAMISLLLSYLFVGMHCRHLIICIFPYQFGRLLLFSFHMFLTLL